MDYGQINLWTLYIPFDDFIYCVECGMFMAYQCPVHWPKLLVQEVPEDVLPASFAEPYAIRSLPRQLLYFGQSRIPGAGYGVFTKMALQSGVRFGPFKGDYLPNNVYKERTWQIFNDYYQPCCQVDGSNVCTSNWMRYVNRS